MVVIGYTYSIMCFFYYYYYVIIIIWWHQHYQIYNNTQREIKRKFLYCALHCTFLGVLGKMIFFRTLKKEIEFE